MRGDGDEMEVSFFWTSSENFLVEVELILVEAVVEVVDVVEVGAMGVGVAEGEIDLFLFTCK